MVNWTLDSILHICEIASILGGGFTVSYYLGKFIQKVEGTQEEFRGYMATAAKDRNQIHDKVERLAAAAEDRKVIDLRLTMLEKWYDELRRGIGIVRE